MKIYMVYGATGSHSNYREWSVKVFLNKVKAIEFADLAERYLVNTGLIVREGNGWRRSEDYHWDYEPFLEAERNNPYDPACYGISYDFTGYKIWEEELAEFETSDFDSTARLLAVQVLSGETNAVIPLMDRLMELLGAK